MPPSREIQNAMKSQSKRANTANKAARYAAGLGDAVDFSKAYPKLAALSKYFNPKDFDDLIKKILAGGDTGAGAAEILQRNISELSNAVAKAEASGMTATTMKSIRGLSKEEGGVPRFNMNRPPKVEELNDLTSDAWLELESLKKEAASVKVQKEALAAKVAATEAASVKEAQKATAVAVSKDLGLPPPSEVGDKAAKVAAERKAVVAKTKPAKVAPVTSSAKAAAAVASSAMGQLASSSGVIGPGIGDPNWTFYSEPAASGLPTKAAGGAGGGGAGAGEKKWWDLFKGKGKGIGSKALKVMGVMGEVAGALWLIDMLRDAATGKDRELLRTHLMSQGAASMDAQAAQEAFLSRALGGIERSNRMAGYAVERDQADADAQLQTILGAQMRNAQRIAQTSKPGIDEILATMRTV